MVATAKSEDGFRKAQQLTEEATETPRRQETADCGIILKRKSGRQGRREPTKPINVLELLDLKQLKNSGDRTLHGSLLPK